MTARSEQVHGGATSLANWWSSNRRAVIVLAATIILLIRKTDVFTNPQFWAEDFMFVLNGQDHGIRDLFVSFAGYLHAIPRLIAAIAAPMDPVLQPGIYVYASLAVTLAVVYNTLSPRLRFPGREWLALAIVAVPHSGEVYLTPTNLQWITALALLVTVCKDDAHTKNDWIVDILFLIFAGFTGPFIVLFSPLFGIRALIRRTRESWLLLSVACIVALPQFWQMLHDNTPPEIAGAWRPMALPAAISWRLVCNLFFGKLWPSSIGMDWTAAAGTLLLAGVVFFSVRGARHRAEVALLILALIILLAVSTVRKRLDLWVFGDLEHGDRYYFIPKIIVLWLTIIVSFDGKGWLLRRGAMVLLVLSIASNSSRFRFKPYTDFHWYQYCDELRAGKVVRIKINPGTEFLYRRP